MSAEKYSASIPFVLSASVVTFDWTDERPVRADLREDERPLVLFERLDIFF